MPPLPLLSFFPSLLHRSQTLVSCDDVYKWARTSDEPWENALDLQGGETQALLPAEASHSATLNGKNPFLPSTTVNTLAFVNSQEVSATDLSGEDGSGGGGRRLSTEYTYPKTSGKYYCPIPSRSGTYTSLSSARDACSANPSCACVYDHGCNGQPYKLCLTSFWYKSTSWSCVYTKEKKKEATEVQASKNLHAIYVKGLTSRDDATHFSTTCHNFGGFRQPRDVCNYNETFPTKAFPALSYAPHYTWTSNSEECLTRFQAVPKCKSVANMRKSVKTDEIIDNRHTMTYDRYRYDPGAATLDATTAFLLARAKFYPEKAKEMFQNLFTRIWYTTSYGQHSNQGLESRYSFSTTTNNPHAADFDPSDPGDYVWVNSVVQKKRLKMTKKMTKQQKTTMQNY